MMTLSLSIVQGFKHEIQKKVSGFGSHIQITNYESKGLLEHKPISKNRDFYHYIDTIPGIEHIQVFANKGAILKTAENNYGVIVKGVGQDFQWEFFRQYLKEGKLPQIDDSKKSNELLISQTIARKLKLKVADEVVAYFVQQPPRFRKFTICGIYNTGLEEMDEQIVIGDIQHIQKINAWEDHQVGGFEILINDIREIETLDQLVYEKIDYDLVSTSIIDVRPDIFNWLELQDVNVIIIISLLILVCGIDIISALLILILERSRMIGILKALGAKDLSIRKIFLYNATYLILIGLFFGNILGLGISWLQLKYGLIGLPQEAYFISQVPIRIDPFNLLLLNAGTLVSCFLMMLVPSSIISKIDPIKSIRFD